MLLKGLPLAFLAATAAHIEGEAAFIVASSPGFIGFGKEGADIIEDARVSRGVAARGAPNRLLRDGHEFIDVL